MKRANSLIDVSQYIREFTLPEYNITPIRVVDSKQATSRLASCSGTQLLIARPELKQTGDSDTYSEIISTVIFVLEKELGQSRTDEKEDEQFDKLMKVTSDVLTEIERETGSCEQQLLSSFTLVSAEIVPEYSIFGGWCGYSIEIVLE